MKSRERFSTRIWIKGSALLMALTLALGSCNELKNLDPLEGVTYKLNYKPANSQIQGLVVDAKTGQSLSIPIQVAILGQDANRVVTFDGKAQTTYSSPKGDLYIGLKGDVPTPQAPARLRLVVDAAGYIPSATELRLTKSLNDPFLIRLVKETDPPQEVSVKKDQLRLSTNATLSANKEIVVASASTPTTLLFSGGTGMKDEKGNPVTGTVAATVAAYAPGSASIPAGLTTPVSSNESGSATANVALNIAGYTSVNLTSSSGQSVTSFTNPILIKMGISPEFQNRTAARRIQVGDLLGVYRRNEKSGIWSFVQDVKVEAQGSGLGVSFPVTHFTDYAVAQAQPTSSTCQAVWTIQGLAAGYAYRYELVQDGRIKASGTSTDQTLNLGEASQGPADLLLYSSSGSLLGKSSVQNLCGNHTLSVSAPQGTVNINFTVRGACENGKNIEVYPTVLVRYGKSGADPTTFVGTTFENGQGTLVGLEANTPYEARVDYEGTWTEQFTTGTGAESRSLTYVLKSHTEACKQ
ncbi:hypothetical protein LX87_04594 [Larkinella arboricola]|uniref:Uncharacterized protein n=1 Tax=Larkinella arboricola TaxID=643671 RepID=A0A327WQG6_LARAB|nr:hypothetical protein [Larkinella arboricola]RAJ93082.1 hypothetical protein LX87_04594 [Larkinella arboricola]